MYDFVDRPISKLDDGGRFLIWSMRSWVKAMSERRCPAGEIGGAFAKWNVIAGLQPFVRIMALFNRHGLETFQFCQLRCDHVSEHEALILSLVCAVRDQRPEILHDTLLLLIEEEQVGSMLESLVLLGRSLDKAGIFPDRTLGQAPASSNARRTG